VATSMNDDDPTDALARRVLEPEIVDTEAAGSVRVLALTNPFTIDAARAVRTRGAPHAEIRGEYAAHGHEMAGPSGVPPSRPPCSMTCRRSTSASPARPSCGAATHLARHRGSAAVIEKWHRQRLTVCPDRVSPRWAGAPARSVGLAPTIVSSFDVPSVVPFVR
jgi:hypothetical protein